MAQKRIVSILTSLACVLSVLCVFGQISSYSSTANEVSALTDLTAEDITSQMTIGWNLGNSLDSYNTSLSSSNPSDFATAWGNPEPTKELIQAVKNQGFNTIRIPTTWFQHVTKDANGNYTIDQTWLNYVKQVVDYAYDENMFVILNLHHEEGIINVDVFTDETLATATKYVSDLWTQIAEAFKDYDQRLIFEGMNEPRQTKNSNVTEWGNGSGDNGYSWDYINKLNSAFINAVRSNTSTNNQQRLLTIPSYVATSDTEALNNLNIPSNAGNVAISVHAYAPYYFTMATDDKASHTFPGEDGWGNNYETDLSNLFADLEQVSNSKNVPIIISEFSASDFNNTSDRVAWATSYLTYATKANIPCVLWDNNIVGATDGEAHGYFNRTTNELYSNSAEVVKAMVQTVGNYKTITTTTPSTTPDNSGNLSVGGDLTIGSSNPTIGSSGSNIGDSDSNGNANGNGNGNNDGTNNNGGNTIDKNTTDGNSNNNNNSNSNSNNNSSTTTTSGSTAKTTNPTTGDSGVSTVCVIALAMGTFAFISRKKK